MAAEDPSGSASDELDNGYLCPLCKVVFATKKQWDDHWDEQCLAPSTPIRKARKVDLYCATCHTIFRSEEKLDYHEPCPERVETSEPKGITTRIAEKSHSPICPGLSEIGIRGSCMSNRHILTAPAKICAAKVLGSIGVDLHQVDRRPGPGLHL